MEQRIDINSAHTVKQRRDVVVDLIKTIAIIGVIIIHTYTGVNSESVTSVNWLVGNLFGCITRGSVPLFLMCSGVLFLNPEKEITIKKIYTKNILRIVVAMLFWATAYKVFFMLVKGNFNVTNFIGALKEVLFFNHEVHFYYLHITLLIYALIPVLKTFTDNASKKTVEYSLVIWFLIGVLYPNISGI